MSKNLYSVLLDDEVVRALDRMALARGMSRSALCNLALAEFAGVLTQEEKIRRIFRMMDEYVGRSGDIVAFPADNRPVMSLKSSLEYKYRPTIRYEVELYRTPGEDLGEISVIFRTQSQALMEAVTAFFRLWCRLENAYLTPLGRGEITYTLSGGRLRRAIRPMREEDRDPETLSRRLADYITLLDTLMKKTIRGEIGEAELEERYAAGLRAGIGLL